MPILNYTTKIDSYKTIMEIQQILTKNGATKIIVDNDQRGLPVALTFCINFKNENLAFSLPCNFSGVLKSMKNNKKCPKNLCNEEQALRVSWRIIKNWVEAQMAIVEAQLVDMFEVFLPYAITKEGKTLYEHLKENNHQILLNENKN